jgi:hypothetical protein
MESIVRLTLAFVVTGLALTLAFVVPMRSLIHNCGG